MPWIASELLDMREEQQAYAREQAAKRAAGDFAPYYVRKIGTFCYTPAAQIYFGRWGVFFNDHDLNNCAPDWWRLGIFWRFRRACRVAAGLRTAFEEGAKAAALTRPNSNDTENTEGGA